MGLSSKHYFTATLSGILAWAFLLYWINHYQGGFAWNSNLSLKLNWHPFLMLFGMVFLFRQAIFFSINEMVAFNMIVQLVVSVLTITGFLVMYNFYSSHKTSHFNTIHSGLGFAAILLYGIQFACCCLSKKYIHAMMGGITLTVAISAAVTGLAEVGYSLGRSSQLTILTFVALFVLIYGMMVSGMAVAKRYASTTSTMSTTATMSTSHNQTSQTA